MTTPPPYDKDLDKILSLTLWGDYQRPDGTWGIGVANREDLKAALTALIHKAAERQFQESSKDFLQTLIAISDDCETDDDGNAEYRARMNVHLHQQLKEVDRNDK